MAWVTYTLFYFVLYRTPVDTRPVTEVVTLFKYQLLLLLLAQILNAINAFHGI